MTMMMWIQSVSSLALLCITPAALAFSSGAGSCLGGQLAVGGPHLNNGVELDFADSGYSLSFDTPLTRLAVVGPTFRGALIRVEGLDATGAIVTDSVVWTPGDGAQTTFNCPFNVAGLTHSSGATKTELGGEIEVVSDAVTELNVDVTIVVQNSLGVSEYAYSNFGISLLEETVVTLAPTVATTPEPTPDPTPAPTTLEPSFAPTTLSPTTPFTFPPTTVVPTLLNTIQPTKSFFPTTETISPTITDLPTHILFPCELCGGPGYSVPKGSSFIAAGNKLPCGFVLEYADLIFGSSDECIGASVLFQAQCGCFLEPTESPVVTEAPAVAVAPVATTTATEAPTMASDMMTEAPVMMTSDTAAPTMAPVMVATDTAAPTVAPVMVTSDTAAPTMAPVMMTEAPVMMTSDTAAPTMAPAMMTEAPVIAEPATEMPVMATGAPTMPTSSTTTAVSYLAVASLVLAIL